MISKKGGNRPQRGTTHRDHHSPAEPRVRAKSPIPFEKLPRMAKEELPPLPTAALVVIPGDQTVLNTLGEKGLAPELVYAHHPDSSELSAFEGFVVSRDVATEMCTTFREQLEQCSNKWEGPFTLHQVTSGRTARPLHRTELPVVPQPMGHSAAM